MKIGVDVNNQELCKVALCKIKESGNVIVDLTVEKWINRGEEVFRKVLLGNITNIDFYIGIEFIKSSETYKIFYSYNEFSKTCSAKIKKSLSCKNINVVCEDGSHLYLIKNMNSPGIYIMIPFKNNNENIEILEKIIKELIIVN